MSVTLMLLLLGGGIGFILGWAIRGAFVRAGRMGRAGRRRV
jgi:hypothetical protein